MKKNRSVLRFFTLIAFAGLLSVVVGATSVYLYLAPTLPSIESLKNIQLQTPLRIYTADGKLIAEFGEKRRTPVAYEDVPQQFYDALIAAEDENFHIHPGIDIKGLARAAYELITTGKKRSGGSTITMQVAKNYYLSSEKTFTRKFTEILLALHIEQELSKKEILELYVNKIYMGKRAYGVEAAAQVYYGRPISELNLAQLAMIAGLPQAPSAANPINNPDRARYRRNYVLARMFTAGFITQEEFDEAGSAPITAKYHGLTTELEAPYIAEMVRSDMQERFPDDLYTKGYQVTTSIQSELQQAAQQSARRGMHVYDRKHGLRAPLTKLGNYVLTEQQEVTVGIPPESWTTSDPTPVIDRHLFLPPSPQDLNEQFWLSQLLTLKTPGDLQWAVVTALPPLEDSEEAKGLKKDQLFEIQVRLADGRYTILYKQDYEWAREYITVNEMGPKIESPYDLFETGMAVLLESKTPSKRELKKYPNRTVDRFWLAQEPEVQSSLVSFNPQNGALLALSGGYDYNRSKFNRATQADRQPGSSFKPFIYSSALEHGFTPSTIFNDAPVVFEDDSLEAIWRPENYSGKFFGPTRLRQALYKSRNLVSIRLLRRTGVSRTINYISKFGLPRNKLNRDLSLALGASGLTPFEITNAYNVLANGGYRVEPFFISKIENREGEVLFEHDPKIVCASCLKAIEEHKRKIKEYEPDPLLVTTGLDEEGNEIQIDPNAPIALDEFVAQFPPVASRVMDERVNYLMYTMLRDVVKRGTARRALVLKRQDLAGKTGTTNDLKDAWFSGFNHNLVASVWVGFDSPRTMGRNAFGSNTALPIWVEYMNTALKGMPHAELKQPDGLVSVRIDPETGNRAYPGQANAIFETFREENIPQQMTESDVFENVDGEESYGNDEDIAPEQLF